MMKTKNPDSFTMMELIIVLVIVSLLAGLALVRFFYVQGRMQGEEGVAILQELYGAQKRYRLYQGAYASNITDLDVTIRTPKNFTNLAINNGSGTVSCGGTSRSWVAQLDANSGAYTLYATTSGQVVCDPCAAEPCQKMGFPANWW